jgi:hypothetical protein
MNKKHSLDFGKKEKVLNYTCQTYQLSRPNKVGAVMGVIRECQPHTIEEWEQWYFENAFTEAKASFGNYSATERMKACFADFEEKFGGKVIVVFSLDGEIANKEVIKEIQNEIGRLHNNPDSI